MAGTFFTSCKSVSWFLLPQHSCDLSLLHMVTCFTGPPVIIPFFLLGTALEMSMGGISGQGDVWERWLRDFWGRHSSSYRHRELNITSSSTSCACIMFGWGGHKENPTHWGWRRARMDTIWDWGSDLGIGGAFLPMHLLLCVVWLFLNAYASWASFVCYL